MQLWEGFDPTDILFLTLVSSFGPVLVLAALSFFMSRTLLAAETGRARPLYLRWLGLFLLSVAIDWFISTAGTMVIFAEDRSQWVKLYGSPLVGALGTILIFPVMVRALAAAAGFDEPRLGATWTFAFAAGRHAYFWYAVSAVAFTVAMVFAFANLLPEGSAANALPGNLVQSAITGTGQLLEILLAIVAASWAAPGPQRQAEVFA